MEFFLLRLFLGAQEDEADPYASKMLPRFNAFHRAVFPRFFSKMRYDRDSLRRLKEGLGDGIPIYITTHVGQLEYNFFNYLYLRESLPLAAYANGLSNWQWMPLSIAKKTKLARLRQKIQYGGRLPHPVTSGHVERLMERGKSIFVRLKVTTLYDDLSWEIPEEDVLQALVRVQKRIPKSLKLIPQQFLWARRPTAPTRSLIDWVFGEREQPGRIRKTVLFCRNYKNHAAIEFGKPLDLKTFLNSHPSKTDGELVRLLRAALLEEIRQERRRITGPALKPKSWIISRVIESEPVRKTIIAIAHERQKETEDVQRLALKYAKEMAAEINYSYIEFATSIMDRVFHTMYDGIHSNPEGLSKIKEIARNSPVVFIPNHLSHMDYLLITTLLYSNNIAVPHVAGGINLSFWPLGRFLRRCGAFFIRRSFKNNQLYKSVFDAYVSILIREGNCLEFFIEGGRSRTGKLRLPRLGMLGTLVHAMLEGAAQELYFVPTSITYDTIVEEGSHVSEIEGQIKKKEKLWDIFKLRKHLNRRYGKIYVHFGEPTSFRETLALFKEQGNKKELKGKMVDRLSWVIMNALSANGAVTPSALVAAGLFVEERHGITKEMLDKNISLLEDYLRFADVKFTDTLSSDREHALQETLQKLVSHRIIESHIDFQPLYYSISDGKKRLLDFQKNTIVEHLLPLAYLAASLLALLKKGEAAFSMEDLSLKIDFLRSLFMFEFISHSRLTNRAMIENTLQFLANKGVITRHRGEEIFTITAPGTEILKVYANLIQNFITSYKIAFDTCRQTMGHRKIDSKSLIKLMFEYGRHLLLLESIHSPEAISKPIFENALRLFKKLGLLGAEEEVHRRFKETIKYGWKTESAAIEELQQELELFS